MSAVMLTVLALLSADPLGPGDHKRLLEVDGHRRSYLVHVPPQYDRQRPTPVVLALHGAATNGRMMISFCGLNEKADEAGFIAVYPNGAGAGGTLLTWNAGGPFDKISRDKPDDVRFIDHVLDDLAEVVHVDPRRVFATGVSNGGMMCYRLAAELSERIAAIAPVSGTLAIDGVAPKRPVPVLHFHGMADWIVPFDGYGRLAIKPLAPKSVEQTINTWVKLNRCRKKPVVEELPDVADDGTTVVRERWMPKPGGAEVVLVKIRGGGHTWPGREPPLDFLGDSTQDILANDMLWDFFTRHPLPEPVAKKPSTAGAAEQ